MAVNQTSSRWKQLLAVSVSLFALACGGDDGGNENDDGNAPTGGTTLANGIVGKECAADTDCGKGGSCKRTQSIGGVNDLLTLLGIDTSIAAPGGYCSIACSNDANCGEGGVCFGAIGPIQGECRKRCADPTDCRPNYECAKPASTADGGVVGGPLALPAQCQALPPTPQLNPNQAGAACDTRADAGVALMTACGTGTCALGSCTATCVSDATCGAGSICVPNGAYGTTGSCQETCAADSDCNQYSPTGTVGCNDVNGRKLCGTKQFPLAAGVLGKACTAQTAATDCGRGGTCAMTLGGGFAGTPAPGGYCTLNGCEDDSVCTGGVCVAGALTLANRCYATCTIDSQCRSGYSCQERPTTTADVTAKVCAPVPVPRDAGAASAVRINGLDAGI